MKVWISAILVMACVGFAAGCGGGGGGVAGGIAGLAVAGQVAVVTAN